MEREDYADTMGELPDALAFMKPMCAEIWALLKRNGSMRTTELPDVLGVSQATVYRRVGELKDVELVEEVWSIEDAKKTEYEAIDPTEVEDRAVWQ